MSYVDDRAWQAAMDDLASLLPAVIQDAGKECAEDVQRETRDILKEHAHAPGTYSHSPSGGPAGEITGELGASVVVTESNDGAMVGPTTEYGREIELGGPMHGHPTMHWRNEGGNWHRHLIVLPPHPYLKPATDRVVDSGMATIIYVDHLEFAIRLVTGG